MQSDSQWQALRIVFGMCTIKGLKQDAKRNARQEDGLLMGAWINALVVV